MLRWRVYLGLFLKACQAGRIKKGSLLLVENLDRLSRNEAMKAINLIQQIVEAGVTIVTRIPERVINTGGGAAGSGDRSIGNRPLTPFDEESHAEAVAEERCRWRSIE